VDCRFHVLHRRVERRKLRCCQICLMLELQTTLISCSELRSPHFIWLTILGHVLSLKSVLSGHSLLELLHHELAVFILCYKLTVLKFELRLCLCSTFFDLDQLLMQLVVFSDDILIFSYHRLHKFSIRLSHLKLLIHLSNLIECLSCLENVIKKSFS
jgi:hypothetical protein